MKNPNKATMWMSAGRRDPHAEGCAAGRADRAQAERETTGNAPLMAADGSKAIGCHGCARAFETVAQVEAHERASGHGVDQKRDPHAEGCAAGRADVARLARHERNARFAAALLKFEDAARALNAAWHDAVPEVVVEKSYPFGETPFDDVCRKITRFREDVDAALAAGDES